MILLLSLRKKEAQSGRLPITNRVDLMGLILKEEKNSSEKELNIKSNITDNYKARYVELAKPMGGAIALAIYYLLGDVNDDPDIKIKWSNAIAPFICWILGEQISHRICVYFNLYTRPDSKNPLYRNLKTLSSLGSALGVIIASLSTSLAERKLSISLYSMLMATIMGLFAFIIQQCGGDYSLWQDEAQLGTEGWSKYAKTALVLGASTGQLLGGITSYLNSNDAATSMGQITLYSAIASVISFFAVIVLVPLINYLTRNKNEEKAKGILMTDDRDLFNNNYVRSGLTLGTALGTILGGLLGPTIGSGLNVEVAIAISASACSIIGGIGLGFYGQNLTTYFEKYWGVSRSTENSWSYAARSSSYFFSYVGIVAAYTLCPGAALTYSTIIGSALASLLGWFTGLFIIWLARQIEPDETKMSATTLPWTQRVSSGTTTGAIIGTFAGLAVSFLVGGPFTLIGWCVLLSALGGIIGGIKNIITDPVFYQLMGKVTSLFCDVSNQSKPNQPSFNANQTVNRYSFFSYETNNTHDSEIINSSQLRNDF
ncbi:hypothetical protein [uncultured Legionella sp.]|uniref:hypothetical protein n=1 Tax=uncultured Legionella sp. TaxID=210934 RepID=UPI002616041B|nr:hypothetical protein [uncultured Legionella sp.]